MSMSSMTNVRGVTAHVANIAHAFDTKHAEYRSTSSSVTNMCLSTSSGRFKVLQLVITEPLKSTYAELVGDRKNLNG
jgi:hypothetical protein